MSLELRIVTGLIGMPNGTESNGLLVQEYRGDGRWKTLCPLVDFPDLYDDIDALPSMRR